MLIILAALLPVFLLILLGFLFRRADFPGGAFWSLIDRFSYFVLFPSLLVKELALADLGNFNPVPLIGALMIGTYGVAAAAWILKGRLAVDGPSFTSIFQGAVRFNTFAGLGATSSLYGGAGVAFFALAVAVMVPQINVLCVTILNRHAASPQSGWWAQFQLFARNPLIIACLIGIALNTSGLRLPTIVIPVFDALGRAGLAFGLMGVGAALDLSALRRTGVPLATACLLKLIAYPLLIALGCWLFDVTGLARSVAILWSALPTAPAAYILARQMGGNAELAAAAITVTTIGAGFTIAPILAWLG